LFVRAVLGRVVGLAEEADVLGVESGFVRDLVLRRGWERTTWDCREVER
jgi:hypothetical protein